ncbi:three-Cys-motif partner protein TcmP [Paenibacillus sp. FSL R5-0876]|uniref:three-Cys-motif partner protein TcmP n=1 Tax=Paenibacillus sp. FSL R5-0876 TaxID=2921661 RepID=UPI0030F7CB90
MVKPKTTLWDIDPHTIAKHIILRNYLRAWFPIMGKYNEKLVFLDGYSGPGEYNNGELGSPVIALTEALDYFENCDRNGWKKPKIVFFFIEENKKRAAHLEDQLREVNLPKEISYEVINSTFEKVGSDLIDFFESTKTVMAPAFLFIDPFGYTLSFEIIKKLMSNPKCEVFINVMYEFINRFIDTPGQEKVMTELFGTIDWVDLNLKPKNAIDRKASIHSLYQKQLENNAAQYVRSFEMRGKRNATKYFMFYGTNNKKGLEKMKDAMWKVDTGGGYSFTDYTDPNQGVLFGDEPDYELLKDIIKKEFSGRRVTIEQLEDYVICVTPFRKAHLKTNTLVPMEKKSEIKVITERKKKWSYPPETIIEFI